MLNEAQQSMIKLDDLAYPITCRYNIGTDWGRTGLELTLDCGPLEGKLEETYSFFRLIFQRAIAFAMSARSVLLFGEIVRWRTSPLPLLAPIAGVSGSYTGPVTNRDNTPVMVLHSGHSDAAARQRLYYPHVPLGWVSDRQLNVEGRKQLYRAAAVQFMGLSGLIVGGPYRWLVAHPRVVESTPANLLGVAFREVQYVRVLSYCEKAPDTPSLDWP